MILRSHSLYALRYRSYTNFYREKIKYKFDLLQHAGGGATRVFDDPCLMIVLVWTGEKYF